MEENNNNQPVSPVETAPVTPETPVTPVAPVEAAAPVEAPVGVAAPVETPVEVAAPVEAPVEVAAPVEAPVEAAAPVEAPVEVATPVEAPVEVATPVVPETENVEAHPVPSLVIEDTSAPVAPETPVVPEEPVAPVAPATPEVPVAPVEAAPVAPEVPVAPVEAAPATPEASVTPAAPVAPEMPTPEAPATTDAPAKKKKNLIPIIIIVVCVIVAAVILFTRKGKNNEGNNDKPGSKPVETTPGTSSTDLDTTQASYNGNTFNFPLTKEAVTRVGWTWDTSTGQAQVEPGATAPGGRIGNEPGGATVMVINNTGETKATEDCTIYSATFSNPKDGSENVTFVGGLGYANSLEEVRNKMVELGYKKHGETTNENTTNLKYFLNDDEGNVNNYVEFYFVDSTIETVTINTSV